MYLPDHFNGKLLTFEGEREATASLPSRAIMRTCPFSLPTDGGGSQGNRPRRLTPQARCWTYSVVVLLQDKGGIFIPRKHKTLVVEQSTTSGAIASGIWPKVLMRKVM